MTEINKAVRYSQPDEEFQWISPHNTWTIVYIQHVLCTHFTSHVPIYNVKVVSCTINNAWHSSHRSKLGHPLLVSLQVRGRDRLGALFDGRGEVFHGGWQLQVFFGYFLDLLRTLALNHATHCHHGCIPEQPKRSYRHRRGPTRSHVRDMELVREHLLPGLLEVKLSRKSRMTVLWLRKAIELANHTKFWWTSFNYTKWMLSCIFKSHRPPGSWWDSFKSHQAVELIYFILWRYLSSGACVRLSHTVIAWHKEIMEWHPHHIARLDTTQNLFLLLHTQTCIILDLWPSDLFTSPANVGDVCTTVTIRLLCNFIKVTVIRKLHILQVDL